MRVILHFQDALDGFPGIWEMSGLGGGGNLIEHSEGLYLHPDV